MYPLAPNATLKESIRGLAKLAIMKHTVDYYDKICPSYYNYADSACTCGASAHNKAVEDQLEEILYLLD